MATVIWPVSGTVTSNIAERDGRMHKGIDVGAPSGAQVVAAANGTASRRRDPEGYGNYIVVKHGSGYETVYGHLSGYAVADGATVRQGQLIGYVGSTGRSSGPHLHFEIKLNGTYRDWDAHYPRGSKVSAGHEISANLPGFPGSSGGTEPSRPILRRGSSGPAVRDLQNSLNRYGAGIGVDGDFGPATEAAVRAFQSSHGLAVDGVVGANTWKTLLSGGSGPTPSRPTLRPGASGAAVRDLQNALMRAGHAVAVDGEFGPATEGAVRAFQAAQRLQVDGVVGPATWGKLE